MSVLAVIPPISALRPLLRGRGSLRRYSALLCVGLLTLAGCSQHQPSVPAEKPAVVKARVQHLLPPAVRDKAGWSEDIYQAFSHQKLPRQRKTFVRSLLLPGRSPGLMQIRRSMVCQPLR